MNTGNKDFCVILAGGKGRRLWPVSREEYPKQFIDFFGTGRTQLQQTYDRFARIIPKENIYVNTNQDYAHLVREQLPDLPKHNLMSEPIHRNTAPSVAWACHEAFPENIRKGLEFVGHNDGLLTMGVKPTRPEPGYGYVQIGDQVGDRLFRVKSFTEKPDREFAKLFIQSGEFYWNTGLFLSRAKYLQKTFMELLPSVFRRLDSLNPNSTVEEEDEFVRHNFPIYPNLSIDHSILERSEQVFVMMCDFGWADVGTWHSIYEAEQKSEDDNVVITSDVILEDSRNNIIKLPEGRLAVINGLDGYIIAEKDNVLLICKKEDSSALVRKYVNEVRLKKGDKYI